MDGFTIAWLVVIGLGAALEAVAIFTKKKGDTLSEHMWRWFAVTDEQRKGLRGLRRTVLLLGMTWLTVHFVTGWRV